MLPEWCIFLSHSYFIKFVCFSRFTNWSQAFCSALIRGLSNTLIVLLWWPVQSVKIPLSRMGVAPLRCLMVPGLLCKGCCALGWLCDAWSLFYTLPLYQEWNHGSTSCGSYERATYKYDIPPSLKYPKLQDAFDKKSREASLLRPLSPGASAESSSHGSDGPSCADIHHPRCPCSWTVASKALNCLNNSLVRLSPYRELVELFQVSRHTLEVVWERLKMFYKK